MGAGFGTGKKGSARALGWGRRVVHVLWDWEEGLCMCFETGMKGGAEMMLWDGEEGWCGDDAL